MSAEEKKVINLEEDIHMGSNGPMITSGSGSPPFVYTPSQTGDVPGNLRGPALEKGYKVSIEESDSDLEEDPVLTKLREGRRNGTAKVESDAKKLAILSMFGLFQSSFNVLYGAALVSSANVLATIILFICTDFNKLILTLYFVSFLLISILTSSCVSKMYKENCSQLTRLPL